MTDAPLRLLVVCTANICRSPMFELMLRVTAEERGASLSVSSAGFLFEGESVSPTVREVMTERGFDIDSHRSRILDRGLVAEADLVLTMERGHARDLVVMRPDSTDLIHTAIGFAELIADLEPRPVAGESARSIIERVAAGRESTGLLGVGSDEVADPHGRHRKFHRETASVLENLAGAVVDGLFPT